MPSTTLLLLRWASADVSGARPLAAIRVLTLRREMSIEDPPVMLKGIVELGRGGRHRAITGHGGGQLVVGDRRQQTAGVRVLRVAEQGVGGALFDDAALVQ